MSASELSGRVKDLIEAGDYPAAAAELGAAWRERAGTETRPCPLPEFPGVWVRFKASGYPFSLRRQWLESRDDRELLAIILRYLEEWNVPDVAGAALVLPAGDREAKLLDNTEISLVSWLIREFSVFLLNDLVRPPKNLFPPSPAS